MHSFVPRRFFVSMAICALFALSALHVWAQGLGTITGRVSNAAGDSYLLNARVQIGGAGLSAFTNEFGEYRLTGVPAGTAVLRVFFTGWPEQTAVVAVASGTETVKNFQLSRDGQRSDGEAVVLDSFVVAAAREIDARSIAINEQRFAPNLKNVVATDEFGDLGNGSVGDFVKFIPGVVIDGEMVSIRGLPPQTVPLSVDGNRMASQFPGDQGLRAAALDSTALNNVARIEVSKSPTPDMPADSLGGAINLVSKHAFERSKPLLSYHAYATGDAHNLSLNERPGPSDRTTTRPIRPGADFTYIAPLSKTFGFTLTGLAYDKVNSEYLVRQLWAPHMISRPGGSAAVPYMAQLQLQNGVTYRSRTSVGTTMDWKMRPDDVVSVGAQYTYALTDYNTYTHNADISGQTATLGPTSYSPTFTQGAAGAARLQYAGSTRSVPITTVMVNAGYKHTGLVWTYDASGFYSKASSKLRDVDYGHFRNTQLRINNATLRSPPIHEGKRLEMRALTARRS